jgi:hypothetical protein
VGAMFRVVRLLPLTGPNVPWYTPPVEDTTETGTELGPLTN